EVDKLDKRGADYVRETLVGPDFGLPVEAVERILAFVEVRSSSHADALAKIDAVLAEAGAAASESLRAGAAELREVLELVKALGVPESAYCLNFSIARGLDYYTGTVYETTLLDHPQIGSICSGGRYEDLASHYTRSKLPGVGISIGLTRLFWQLREAGLIAGIAESSVQAMVALMDEARLDQALDLARHLRAGGINTEVQMEARKVAKQFQYAARAGIRFVVLAGEDELARGVVAVKDLAREQQFEVPRDELAGTLRVELEQARALAGRSRGTRPRRAPVYGGTRRGTPGHAIGTGSRPAGVAPATIQASNPAPAPARAGHCGRQRVLDHGGPALFQCDNTLIHWQYWIGMKRRGDDNPSEERKL